MKQATIIHNVLREKDKPLTGFAQKMVEAAQKAKTSTGTVRGGLSK